MSKALKAAIEANDAEAVVKAAKSVKDLDRKLPKSSSPLMLACELGSDQALKALIEAGAAVKGVDGYVGNHPFGIAEKEGRIAVMRMLAERGLVPEEVLEHVFGAAILGGREETVAFMFKTMKPRVGQHELDVSTWWQDGGMFRLLMEHGADVNARYDGRNNRDMKGQTALHAAARNGRVKAIRMLTGAGADINARDVKGRTPLMGLAGKMAEMERSKRRREEFERNPKLTVLQSSRSGERTLVREEEDGPSALRLLIEMKADASAKDADGNDALDYYRFGCMYEREEIDAEIVKTLKNAEAKGDEAFFGLFKAIRNKDIRGLGAALEKCADVNRVSARFEATPLLWAETAEQADLLLNAGADPNKPSGTSLPLIYAARTGRLDVVKRLVKAGANIHAIEPRDPGDEYLANAYSAAEDNQKYEVVDYLKSLGAGQPVRADWKPLEAGVGMWENFTEILVRADVDAAAKVLARMIGGTAQMDAHGKSFKPGKRAYALVQPKGMAWTNVLRITPVPAMFEEDGPLKEFAKQFAKAARGPTLLIQYSDTSGAASVDRFEPDGATTTDDGWDRATLEEVTDELGDKAPAWMKKKRAKMEEEADDTDSSTRLIDLAKRERFVVASFGLNHEPGRPVEVAFTGLPAEAFDGIAWVSN